MIKKLTRYGDSLALIIEQDLLDFLKIDLDTPLDISTDGRMLFISPSRDNKRRKAFLRALEKAEWKYGNVLKRLAD